jgi:competence protein ComEC
MTYRRIRGNALLRPGVDSEWQLGDVLRFNAAPKTPFESEDFSYRDYLERSGIYSVIYFPVNITRVDTGQAHWFDLMLERLRLKASNTVFAIYPQPESGLMAGILLGNDNDLPDPVSRAYRDTGTAHIIAISGFNMVMLTKLITLLFSKVFNRKKTMLLTSLVLIFYTLFVGASPSVVRAMIMAIFAFGGQLFGRKNVGMNVLGLTAGLMVVVNPKLPCDASFQLSFMATLGLLLLATPMQEWLYSRMERRFSEGTASKLNGPIGEYIICSLAAQLMTLPVIALQFHRLSLTSLIVNPLVLPVQPPVLVCGMVATLAGMIWLPLGRLLGVFTWPLVAYSNAVVEFMAGWKWGAITITHTLALWLSVAVAIMILVFLLRDYFMKIFTKMSWFYLSLALVVIIGLIAAMVARRPDGNLHLFLIRAGEGSSVFMRSPTGTALLIDPSGSPNQLASAASRRVSPWNFHVDAALLTNREAAQQLDELNQRLPVETAILTQPVYRPGDNLAPITLPADMAVKQLAEYEIVQIEENLTIQPITGDSENTALLISYGNTRILIPSGVKPELLLEQNVAPLGGLSVLILNEKDIHNLPADMWQNFGAQVILWNSPALSPDPAWLGLDRQGLIEIIGDGVGYDLRTE